MSETVLRKLAQAHRRMNVGHFLAVLVWTLSGTLLAGCALLFASKLFALDVTVEQVLGASMASGFVLAAIIGHFTRPARLEAAVALDRAFGLKERVSTLMALQEPFLSEPAGVALRTDVENRLKDLLVAEKIPVRAPRFGWLPALPLAGLLALGYLVGPLDWLSEASARSTTAEERKRIVEETKLLEKKLAERKQEIAESDLDEDLKELTQKIEDASREITDNKKTGAKEAVVKLGDLAKVVQERREQLDSVNLMQRNLSKLQKMQDGPAKELADALKDGDFKKAAEELSKLQKQLQEGNVSAENKEKLSQQLSQMQQQMKQMADMSQRAKQLEQSLPPDLLKQELAKLAQDGEKLEKLKELAEKLGQCSKCMGGQPGEGKAGEGKAGDKEQNEAELQKAMAEAQQVLDQLRKDCENCQMLDKMLNDLDQCRGGMCKGNGNKQGNKPGNGLGKGQGAGDRPESPDDVRSREQKAQAKLKQGEAYIIGKTEGRSFKGESLLEIREAASNAARAADEAITRQKVPRDYQKHTRDYFEQLNGELKD